MPSHRVPVDLEPLTWATIEGMAYGLPAIVPTVGGITEVIVEGATGYSVDNRDAERLSARLSELLGDEARYQRFSAAAKARVARFRETAFKAQSLATHH